MYSFKKFLVEGSGEVKTIAEILDECAPFLRASEGKFVFRGLKNPTGALKMITPDGDVTVYRMEPRRDRRPLNIDEFTHTTVDDYMDEKFGFRGRSQGLFVTSSPNTASSYGDTYIILPRGEFRFIWSPKISDLFMTRYNAMTDLDKELKKLKYQMKDLPGAILSTHEIMIDCKDFYAIPYTVEIANVIRKEME